MFWTTLNVFSRTQLIIGRLTSISHQQLLRGGKPVGVFVFSWSDDVDAIGAFKDMSRDHLTYVANPLKT